MGVESHGGMTLAEENCKTWRKTCPSATLPITNPTWTDPGANPWPPCLEAGNEPPEHGTVCISP
jgi:hypothetical protein